MIIQTGLTLLADNLLARMTSAQAQCGEAWYPVEMSGEVMDESRIVLTLTLPGSMAEGETITAVRVLDNNSNVIAQRNESINREGSTDSLLYRLEYTISAQET